MRLVVCVDRDDDLGRKAGVQGPIVGRADAIDAATRLAIVDPEDSDTNAIFAAVSLLDELRGAGEDCEVCILTGSPKVGVLSDRRVADQFDHVLATVKATSAYLVSDGAEDEYLFPILASRVRVDGVRRVYIRQSASIESTYYTVIRALKDPKLRAKTVLPFALVLLTLGIAAAGGVFLWGIIGLSILLGVYLVFWTFDIDEAIIDSLRSASTDIRQGSAAFGFGLFAIALVGVGFLEGYNAYAGPRRSLRCSASSCSSRPRSSGGSRARSSGSSAGPSVERSRGAASPGTSGSRRPRSSAPACSAPGSSTSCATSRVRSARASCRS